MVCCFPSQEEFIYISLHSVNFESIFSIDSKEGEQKATRQAECEIGLEMPGDGFLISPEISGSKSLALNHQSFVTNKIFLQPCLTRSSEIG